MNLNSEDVEEEQVEEEEEEEEQANNQGRSAFKSRVFLIWLKVEKSSVLH